MLFSILFIWVFWVRSQPRFLHSDLPSGCDVILILHSHWMGCMWYCYVWKNAFSLDEYPFSPVGGRIFVCLCILIGRVVCSGLEKKEASMFEMALNSFVILEINL